MRTYAFTIKSYMIVFLVVLGLASAFASQRLDLIFQMVFVTVVTAVIDILINFAKTKKLILPSSAIISGLFIGTILPSSSIPVMTAAALLAMFSKHIIKFHGHHILNPAAFGIVISGIIFKFVPIWWSSATLLSIPLGLFIVYKQRKWFLIFPFIITYYIILVLQNISNISLISLVDPTLLFFAFFMLIEPLTSTYAKPAMVMQGIMVGTLVILISTFVSGVDIFLLPLLISNLFVGTLNKKFRTFGLRRP